jgi:hypothetical protein
MSSGLRSGHTYSWYSTDPLNNGGDAGSLGANTCNSTLADPPYNNKCNTQNFVAAVNAVGLCGASDWRLPARNELLSLVNSGQSSLTIDANYFPNTGPAIYWARNSAISTITSAWGVSFGLVPSGAGSSTTSAKTTTYLVRLVRG